MDWTPIATGRVPANLNEKLPSRETHDAEEQGEDYRDSAEG